MPTVGEEFGAHPGSAAPQNGSTMTQPPLNAWPTADGTREPESTGEVIAELKRLDQAAYDAVAQAPTPTVDAALRRLSRAADKSKLWFGVAGALAVFGGPKGRQAALSGAAAIGVTSAVVNLGFKRVASRTRPDRAAEGNGTRRHVPMPKSSSFPSGHSASAFAFAEAVSTTYPLLGIPLRLSAAAVAYSRVHTGVHYPGDVIAGSLIGMTAGEAVSRVGQRVAAHHTGRPG